MIVIFLDVDGVLNSINHLVEIYNKTKRPHSGYEYPFDEKCINNLKLLTKLTNAKIVISSSWRKNQDGRETLLKVLKEHSLAHLVIGWTPDLGGPREEV